MSSPSQLLLGCRQSRLPRRSNLHFPSLNVRLILYVFCIGSFILTLISAATVLSPTLAPPASFQAPPAASEPIIQPEPSPVRVRRPACLFYLVLTLYASKLLVVALYAGLLGHDIFSWTVDVTGLAPNAWPEIRRLLRAAQQLPQDTPARLQLQHVLTYYREAVVSSGDYLLERSPGYVPARLPSGFSLQGTLRDIMSQAVVPFSQPCAPAANVQTMLSHLGLPPTSHIMSLYIEHPLLTIWSPLPTRMRGVSLCLFALTL